MYICTTPDQKDMADISKLKTVGVENRSGSVWAVDEYSAVRNTQPNVVNVL